MGKQGPVHGPVLILSPGGFGGQRHQQRRRIPWLREVPERVANIVSELWQYTRQQWLKVPAEGATEVTILD